MPGHPVSYFQVYQNISPRRILIVCLTFASKLVVGFKHFCPCRFCKLAARVFGPSRIIGSELDPELGSEIEPALESELVAGLSR